MAVVGSVFKALGKLAVGGAKVTGNVALGGIKSAPGFTAGVSKEIGNLGIGLLHDSYNLIRKGFRSTGSWKESAAVGQIIPFKLKHGLGAAGFLAMVGTGGITENVSESPKHSLGRVEKGDFEEREIANTIYNPRSPKIDNMGATGNLVLAAHNGR